MQNFLRKGISQLIALSLGIAILAVATPAYAQEFNLAGTGAYTCSTTGCDSVGVITSPRLETYQEFASVSGTTINGSIQTQYAADAINFTCELVDNICTGTYTHADHSGGTGTFSQTFDSGVPGSGNTDLSATGS